MSIYNEIEPFAADWLRNLIAAGHIAPGDVDDRSIMELRAADVVGRTQFHTFAGIGAWSYALRLAGWPDDVPVWTGSCPCQPFSAAGKRGGFDDARHLWPTWFDLIRQCRPSVVFGEQVASPDGLEWFDAVSADLEGAGYAVGAADLCAAGVGAPHLRQRLYFVAYAHDAGPQGRVVSWDGTNERAAGPRGVAGGLPNADGQRLEGVGLRLRERGSLAAGAEADGGGEAGAVGDTSSDRSGRLSRAAPGAEAARSGCRLKLGHLGDELAASGAARDPWADAEWLSCSDGKARPTQPGLHPLAHGAPGRVGRDGAMETQPRVGRLRAYGNAIVPQVAAVFIRSFMEAIRAANT